MKHSVSPLESVNITNSITPASYYKRDRLSLVCPAYRDCSSHIQIMFRIVFVHISILFIKQKDPRRSLLLFCARSFLGFPQAASGGNDGNRTRVREYPLRAYIVSKPFTSPYCRLTGAKNSRFTPTPVREPSFIPSSERQNKNAALSDDVSIFFHAIMLHQKYRH